MRFAKEADLPRILEIYAPYVLNSTSSFEYTVPSPEEFSRRFAGITAQFPWLVWEADGQIQGYAYGSAPFERKGFAWCSEASVYISPEYSRRGAGKALYGALEKILTAQGYRTVYAIITDENRSSIAFHEAMGYHLTASLPECGFKFGKILGVVYMEKRLNSVGLPMNTPVPWFQVVKDDVNIE